MLKRIVPILVILFALPAMVHAWTITASTSPAIGGTITPSGSINMPTFASTQDFVVAPAAGYIVSRVTVDGINTAPNAGTTNTYTVGYKTGSNYRTIVAYFTLGSPQTYSISVNLGPNGSYKTSPVGQTLTNIPAGSSRTLVFTPYYGYQVDTLTAPGAVITDANDGLGSRIVAYTNIQANLAVSASFKIVPIVIANAGPDRSTIGNSVEFAIALDGSQSSSNMGPISYSWTSTGPGTGVFSDPSAQKPTFYSITPGAYTITLTITSGGIVSAPDSAVVTVVSTTDYKEQICSSCHSWRTPTVISTYDASPHKAATSMVVVCQTCHDPTNTGHYSIARPVNGCTACHISVTPQVVTDYQGSPHAAASITCVSCHADHSVLANGSLCQSCHGTVTPKVVTDYLGSLHATNATRVVNCYDCHAPHAAKTAFTICLTCHTSFPANLNWHASISLNYCQNCHNPHYPEDISIGYPHFSSYSTAQYYTPNISCEGCHIDTQASFNVYSANHQWAKSGHADPLSPAFKGPGPDTTDNLQRFDFKFLGTPLPATPATTASDDCVRCHTTTGFANYVNSNFSDIHAWGVEGDRTREMVACPACHTPTPFDAGFSRRSVKQVTGYYNYSSAASGKLLVSTFDPVYEYNSFINIGPSNLCIACHSGKQSGATIKAIAAVVGTTGNFWQNVGFIDPHGMGAAGSLFQTTGYYYRADTDYDWPQQYVHWSIAFPQSPKSKNQGACIACHMEGMPQKHLFTPFSTAGSGAITGITTASCFNATGCHSFTPDFLQTKKEGYQASLSVLARLLEARSIFYNAAKPPYFFTDATYATSVTDWENADVMGAAFNLRLLQSEKGAWAHNDYYAKRLLYDTIDYLDDGNPNNSTVFVTIQDLSTIDQDARSKAQTYIGVRP